MKRCILILLILGCGCGIKQSKEVSPFRSPEVLTNEGWQYYVQGKYDTAEAKFDSAISITCEYFDALVGAGWSKVQLGKYSDAYSLLSIALAMKGGIVYSEEKGIFEYKGLAPDSESYIMVIKDKAKTPILTIEPKEGEL